MRRKIFLFKNKILFLFYCFFLFKLIFILCYKQKDNLLPSSSATITIISATYYHTSKFYKPNTMVLHYNAKKTLSLNHKWICLTQNYKGEKLISPIIPYPAFKTSYFCEIQTFASNCSTVENPTHFALTSFPINKNSDFVNPPKINIPFRKAVSGNFNVISCVSPLFLNEKWQINLLSIEMYSYFGVNKQIYYFMSILENGFQLLKEYEKFGLIILHPWIVPDVDNNLIRMQSDFRNQASALNDCYLLYREAAEFIIVHDPDDIFIPTNGNTIYSNAQISFQKNPSAAWIPYLRYHTKIKLSKTFNHFSILKSLKSAKISNDNIREKSLHRTAFVGSAWTHYARNVKYGFTEYNITEEHGFFIHIRNITFIDDNEQQLDSDFSLEEMKKFNFNLFFRNLKEMLGGSGGGKMKLKEMQQNFSLRFEKLMKIGTLKNLTLTDFYSTLIDKCYNQIFYDPNVIIKYCPTHFRCQIPEISGLRCIQAEQNFGKSTIENQTVFYSNEAPRTVLNLNGCKL